VCRDLLKHVKQAGSAFSAFKRKHLHFDRMQGVIERYGVIPVLQASSLRRLTSMLTASTEPVLILVHGATGNGRMWDPVRRHLEPRWRVIAPDLPGHGARRDETFHLQAAVDTVVAVARDVAPAPVIVGGDSLGGYTALASAAALPRAQLLGLVLGGASANFEGRALRALLVRQWLMMGMGRLLGEKGLAKLLANDLRKMGQSEADIQAQLHAGLNHRVFPQAVRALRGIDFRARLAAVEQPVLIANGSKDKLFVEQEASFLAVARHATSHRFQGCDHGVSLRRSGEFAALVAGFATRLSEPAKI
jgi:pimeloyl-ACP methyl ester carboxylesterase